MPTSSLKAAASCLGLSGIVSVRRDFFGLTNRVFTPFTRVLMTLSIAGQIGLLRSKHVHLNLIRTAEFTAAQAQEIDVGIQLMRAMYATVNIGVGRIRRFTIPPGFEIIDSTSEAEDLWNNFNGPDGAIDVFLALVINGAEGKSPAPHGSCDKDSKNDSGCVVAVADNSDGIGLTVGQAIAHEVGHFLGLHHQEAPDNLMFPYLWNGGKLSPAQGWLMTLHCAMNGGCPI